MPPLPGAAAVLKPVARVTASTIVRSPRAAICAEVIASTLAGVSRLASFRREPAASGVDSGDACAPSLVTRTAGSSRCGPRAASAGSASAASAPDAVTAHASAVTQRSTAVERRDAAAKHACTPCATGAP